MRHSDNAGTEIWKQYMDALRAGGAVDHPGQKPRGASAVSPFPMNGEVSQLPLIWEDDAEHASHVIYHHGTPVAWIDGRDNGWVIPPESYSPTTSGVQNRIRARLERIGYRHKPKH
jgi:hypothetical protein